jgi:integrase
MLKLVRRDYTPYWVVRGSVRGRRVEESTGTSDRRLAEEIRANRESEIHREHVYGRSATKTFAHAAAGYLEAGKSTRFLLPIIDALTTTPLAKVDLACIERVGSQLYPGASPSTLNRQVFTPISAVLHHAAKRGMCALPVIERPREPKGRIRWLTLEEANRLIDACSEHLRPLVIFLLYTGARVGEALWLDWHEVDLVRRQVVFLDTKNGDNRGVPLAPRVVAPLANLPHREGEVFRRPDGLPYTRPTTIDDTSAGSRIKTAFKATCQRARIEDFHPHDCRHTFASWHYQRHRDLDLLMKLGGWKTVSMVMRYAHGNVAHLAPSVDELPGGKLGGIDTAKGKTA